MEGTPGRDAGRRGSWFQEPAVALRGAGKQVYGKNLPQRTDTSAYLISPGVVTAVLMASQGRSLFLPN